MYTGASGTTYTADAPWLMHCNGWVASPSQSTNQASQVADCEVAPGTGGAFWNQTQQLVHALGSHGGRIDPATNYAVSAFTAGDRGAPFVEFETVNNIPFSASGRFITFSVDVAAINCLAHAHPLLQFSLLDEAGAATPVGAAIDACPSPVRYSVPAIGAAPASGDVFAGTYTSNGAMLFSGRSIGVRMVNTTASGFGNDDAFDNIRILDVTPTLSKAFRPASLAVGSPSTLTFKITNTSELASKNGWSFTDRLRSGLVVASPTNASTTCSGGQVTATADGSTVAMTGNLDAGQRAPALTATAPRT
jgi:hypothetical protein